MIAGNSRQWIEITGDYDEVSLGGTGGNTIRLSICSSVN
jgi:hypothetical protein